MIFLGGGGGFSWCWESFCCWGFERVILSGFEHVFVRIVSL